MSGRHHRPPSGRSGVRKVGGSKKKTQVRQAWDSSIQDLEVHRATPEELAHRHEIHRSKNQSLAQWELKKKLLKKEWTKNGGTPDPLQERRLALMMEILSDQYQMKDVLERSDRAMAVVKDLFGDAPRRHTGFPHVTMAPSCDLETSRGPIAQKKDPPTRLSILSESIMDSQALNEVDDTQYQDSEEDDDDDDVDVSISFQPGLRTDRVRRILDEESSRLTSEQWSRSRDVALNMENPLVTPRAGGPPPDGQIALNATAAVKKVKTRLTEEEHEEPQTSSVIGRVLNPQPLHHRKPQSKGKKKRPSQAASGRSTDPQPTSTYELSGCSQSSLDVLNQMIQEVERELETYERESGREVSSMPQPQGLTGFTLSLVSSIRRLVSYLKESDRQLRQESLERQRLKEELGEQRLLIDALTAEILAIKEGSSLSPGSHHFMSDQSQSPGEAATSLPMASPEQMKAPTSSGSAHMSGSKTGPAGLQSVKEHEDSAAPHPGYGAPSITRTAAFGEAASLLDFQPAIMLSPPKQTTRSDFGDHSSLLLSSHDAVSSSSDRDLLAHCPERWRSAAPSIPCVSAPHPHRPALVTEHQMLESRETNAAVTNNDIVSRMAELTCQNNALKAQLKQFSHKTGHSMDAAQEVAENKEAPSIQSPATLEMRIAELNRQSAEARDKLLRLIEQQKQSLVVSPAISPITPQQEESEKRVRLIDAVIPMPQFTDSSIEETPSPGSRGSGRRSSASQRSNLSVSGSSRGRRSVSDGQRVKVGKDREEGWFALSAHVS
ncbi:spindle and centriole-associated protein 1 isoform X2 [Dendropsophus ebraccatus]|uniref:spindle and centriole-associated protein 1 isoform X2 n=1 Tax=Dendropsophus ebraccatus TaxID=150705 RepID=UPI003831C4C8